MIALDVLRALARDGDSLAAFDAEVARAAGADRRLDDWIAHTRRLAGEVASDPQSDAAARRLVGALALALQGSLLVRHAPHAVADAFCTTRLSGDPFGGALYGALPAGVDAAAIAARVSTFFGESR